MNNGWWRRRQALRPRRSLGGAQRSFAACLFQGINLTSVVRGTAAVLLVAMATPLFAEPTSIQEFISREPQFGQLVGATFNLEGRASLLTSDELRMNGTEFRFVFNQKFDRPRKFPHVQMVGRLERDAKGFHFLVTSLSDYKPETEVIRDRLRQGDSSNPQLFYDQAEWVERRGEFYADEALRAEATRLRTLGVQAEERRIAPDEPARFLALAQRAAQWGLDQALRMELLHSATRAELLAEARNKQPLYSSVLTNIRARLPGAEQPLPEVPQETWEAYQRRPEETYAAADAAQRAILHRLLFIEAALKLAATEAKPDGSNGSAVAATIERLVPERPDLPARYRAAELDYLESQIAKLDRAAVLELRNKLREAGQPERATAAVRQWIDLQLQRRPKGPATEIDRAEFEFEMTQDAERALALAAAAMNTDPQVPGGKEILALLGYGWFEGRPVRKELIPAAPPDPFAQAIQEGRILVGMSDGQVSAALGGQPDSVVRMASQDRVIELWHYSGQRLTLQLEATRKKPQLSVARILELKGPKD